MDYNSNRKKLSLPEYGRHIHKMVEHARTIEDREERTRCAQGIIEVMGNLFPHLRDVSDFKHKLWDHLAIMADFNLDIDFPYEPPQEENFHQPPERLGYSSGKMSFKHYGTIIEEMIAKATEMEEGPLKDHLIMLIANHMKKSLSNWNKDVADDERIFSDIKRLSQGKLTVKGTPKIPTKWEHQSSAPRSRKKFQKKPTHSN